MRIALRQGRVQDQAADALVRAVPRSALDRGRDPLLTAAGPEVREACHRVRRSLAHHGLAPGDAAVTGAGRLPAVWLIHVRVPQFSGQEDRAYLLAAAHRAVLASADDVAATDIALAPLGTQGPYWPLDDVVRIGLGTLLHSPTRVRQVILVSPAPAVLEAFAEALARR